MAALAARTTSPTWTSAVLDLTVGDTGTLVGCRRHGVRDALAVGAVPDPVGGRRLRATLRRVAWVSLDLTGDRPVCRVAGVQRRPVQVAVPVSVGLALIDEGTPGVVRTLDEVAR